MKRTIDSGRIPLKLWLDDLEEGALEQAKRLTELPFAFHHVAVMPDSHRGYGMPIGGVLATRDVVIPNGVGVDIGCGVCAAKSSLQVGTTDYQYLERVVEEIRRSVPTGFHWHENMRPETLMPPIEELDSIPVVRHNFQNARKQLGTLGGGNHFIELQRSEEGYLWIMIHSGSRNLGKQVADTYNQRAQEYNGYRDRSIPPKWQLAFLPLESDDGKTYLKEMQYCVNFAKANRLLIMAEVQEILAENLKEIRFDDCIHAIHNYAAKENHFGVEVIVHRKGAIRVGCGEYGIVPGSQGTPSFLVRGLGNPESFESYAHGAGRCLGRRQAIRQLEFQKERKSLEDQGILHSLKKKKDLDEAPGAYKDINTVMSHQKDLVEIEEKLQPIAVIKG